uniref:DEP domain-containing protein n=1 Tax=Strongyloides papillosus TaxID=174720 RepID=A0A0N5B8D4_STREA
MENSSVNSTGMTLFKATNLFNLIKSTFVTRMPLKKHRSYLRVYDDSFTGKEAVNFMVETLPSIISTKIVLTRSNCEQLLTFLLTKNIFYNVRNEFDTIFKDDLSIYKFYENHNEIATPVKRSYSVNESKMTLFDGRNSKYSKEKLIKSNASCKGSYSNYDFPEFATTNIKLIKFFGLNEETNIESKNSTQKDLPLQEQLLKSRNKDIPRPLSVNEVLSEGKMFSSNDKTCGIPKLIFEEISSVHITSWKFCIISFIKQHYSGKEIFKLFNIEDELVAWNCEKVGSKGIVKCFKEREEISSYLLRMMRFLARYPNDSNKMIGYDKQYCGIELDTYRNILSEISRKGVILPIPFSNALADIYSLKSTSKLKNDFSPIIKKIKESQFTKIFNRTSNKSINFGVFSRNTERSSFHNIEKRNKRIPLSNLISEKYTSDDDVENEKKSFTPILRESLPYIDKENIGFISPRKNEHQSLTSPSQKEITDSLKNELYSFILLLLPPQVRRKLHIILRFMNRISENTNIMLSQKNSNKVAVLKTMTPLLIMTKNQAHFHLQTDIIEYLMDNEADIFKIPEKLISDRNELISNCKTKTTCQL